MLKKIVLGALMVGLVGALVAGAVNRTQSKLGGEVSGNGGNRQGQVQQLPQDAAADPHAERETERSAEGADSAASQGGTGAGSGRRTGNGNGNGGASRDQEAGPAEAGERITLDGVVEAVDAEAIGRQAAGRPDGRGRQPRLVVRPGTGLCSSAGRPGDSDRRIRRRGVRSRRDHRPHQRPIRRLARRERPADVGRARAVGLTASGQPLCTGSPAPAQADMPPSRFTAL